ncbi:MAG: amidophosphoribosyltransferase [Gammaproteobacteria bacterium]|jgi:amidophosphoribosyltransferase|nr:amidophosphoribosyltransferase [Gammaproteobacteria bacterium]MBT3725603.1 amidophosphoribosyltransferase [Gammaproteobacteria bacterium]MBT4078632.1 amidophosphoribosyltransferase [Gammaproteobacteria bacterium]MBT4196947.1 amidophosphoribosyltransferase [Gammaproteobacteria bacterium]MBT4449529.1 amidophosphoribosyltransferase [Gammaproteobacteria bacterium]
MCGIIGIVSKQSVAQIIYDGLLVLQHRGQDAAGMVICEDRKLHLRKDNGQVSDVFHTRHMAKLYGNMGIGHVRYPTAGCSSSAEAQPFYVNSPYGISLAHNGNLTNIETLKADLYAEDRRHINTESDSEVLLNVLAHELQVSGKLKLNVDDIFQAVKATHKRIEGAYAVVAMITGKGILAFRDPFGIRPVVYGKRETDTGTEFMVASESVALQTSGFELVADLQPGEAIYIDKHSNVHIRQCAENPQLRPCIFEHVYMARPDSVIDDIYVYKARLRMGVKLAKKILNEKPDHDIDVVIPIPDTSRPSAMELAYHLGVKYREGFIKNRYIGRTFIMPGQVLREKSVRRKLNPIDIEFKGKNVLLVDDSIVRGTTSQQIIEMARDAGANKVYMASAAPAVRYPNVYGIDMPAVEELIAHDRTDDEVGKLIGADWMVYQDLDDLIAAVQKGNLDIKEFDCSCFNGQYVTNNISDDYLDKIKAIRNDSAKNDTEEPLVAGMDLHNNA